ncbi:hypothetical protein RQN30_11400 [Arcanobacterium hippocoleae]
MFWNKKSKAELAAELVQVNHQISALKINTPRFQQAQEIVAANKGKENTEINEILAAQKLPSMEEIGLIVAKSIKPLWALNRKKAKLEQKIAKFSKY